MKTLVLMLICSSLVADPTIQDLLEIEHKCPPPKIEVVVKQESTLPEWAWFALGGLAGVAGVSFFYYNRQAK